MSRVAAGLKILPVPLLVMGGIQVAFAGLSIASFHEDRVTLAFFLPGLALLLIGAVLMLPKALERRRSVLSYTDSLLFVALTWWVCGLAASIPIMLVAHLSFSDAVFEAISALPTTGASVISGLDDDPRTILMYRQFLQWLGGLGVVIFVVAVMPMLNIGGMRLFKAETPGPMKDDKLSPRISHTAQYLWTVYFVMTVACTTAYLSAGMSFFDALAHAFSTVSTGGFSPHDASLGHFDSPGVRLVANVFMLLGAINFGLHFRAVQQRSLRPYWRNEEVRWLLGLTIAITAIIGIFLTLARHHESLLQSLDLSLFHTISFMTSTGFVADDYNVWPTATSMILVFAMYIGGCSGSTAGGNKVVRDVISLKSISIQFKRLVHPDGWFTLKYQGRPVADDVKGAVMSFMTVAAFASLLLTLAMMATGLDFWSSFTAVVACLNNAGPAYGAVSSNFQPVSDLGVWMLSTAMILGRLEYFTVLVLFTAVFWRR